MCKIHIYVNTCIYIYMCIYIHIHIYIYIFICLYINKEGERLLLKRKKSIYNSITLRNDMYYTKKGASDNSKRSY